MSQEEGAELPSELDDFAAYARYAVVGWLAGLLLAWWARSAGVEPGGPTEGAVRFLAGTGDTLGGGLGVLIARLRGHQSAAEPFAVGTLLGMLAGPIVHAGSVYFTGGTAHEGLGGVGYAIAYSNFDNYGGLLWSWRERGDTRAGVSFQACTLFVLVALGLLAVGARLLLGAPPDLLWAGGEGVMLNTDTLLTAVIFLALNRTTGRAR